MHEHGHSHERIDSHERKSSHERADSHERTESHDGSGSRIGWAFFLNLGFTVIEFVGGVLTNSTAIMADAVHDLGDSLSIGLAWVLARLSGREASESFTYGYRRFSLLGSLINGLILVAGSIWVMAHAIPRLFEPEMPVTEGMFALAIFGIAVNGFAAYKLSHGKTLNERVLNWHLLEDVLGWVAVLVVSVVLMFVEWPILDPLLSIGFTLFILANVVRTLWQTVRLFLQGTPSEAVRQTIEQALRRLPRVTNVHHLHFWSLDGEHHVLTAHVVVERVEDVEQLRETKECISSTLARYGLAHTTVEVELAGEPCRDQ